MKKRAGFSLVELLIAIAVIAVLLMLLMPALGSAKEQANLTRCAAKIRQVNMAVLQYAGERNGTLPRWNRGREPVPIGDPPGGGIGDNLNPAWSQMLVDANILNSASAVWKCPEDLSDKSEISYTINATVAGHRLSVLARHAETILLTERYDKTSTRKINSVTYAATPNVTGVQTSHPRKALFAFLDGHVAAIAYNQTAGSLNPPDEIWKTKR